MLDAISGGGMDVGALGAAFNKDKAEKARERTEAIRLARSAQGTNDVEKKVQGVAEEFVSVFMNQVMKSMRATVPENPAMHGDNGEKFFQEMLDGEQSKFLAKGSGYGLTDLVYQSLMASYRVTEPGAGEASGPIEDKKEVKAVGF